MTDEEVEKSLAAVTADLRYAYGKLATGNVIDQPRLANDLLSPAIKRLVTIAAALDQRTKRRAADILKDGPLPEAIHRAAINQRRIAEGPAADGTVRVYMTPAPAKDEPGH